MRFTLDFIGRKEVQQGLTPPVVETLRRTLLDSAHHGQANDRLLPVDAVLDDLLHDRNKPFLSCKRKERFRHHKQHKAPVVELELTFRLVFGVRRTSMDIFLLAA